MPIQQMLLGAGGSLPVKVQDVFDANTRTGINTAQTITNSMDLSGEGGLVWTKSRSNAFWNVLYDTERGGSYSLTSNNTNTQATNIAGAVTFNNNGYSIAHGYGENNYTDYTYIDWVFRKHPKFFDIQTATVSASGGSGITHELECDVGMAIFKSTNNTSQGANWLVWHKNGTSVDNQYFNLNTNSGRHQQNNTLTYNSSNKTFTFGYPAAVTADRMRPGTGSDSNVVGYFFAHNNNNGGFGDGRDEDIIKVGTYTGNGSSTGTAVSIGFEPQFVMIKRLNPNTSGNWFVFDTARGVSTGGNDSILKWSDQASETSTNYIKFTSTGFQLENSSGDVNASGNEYIYMAIRKDQS